MKRKLKYKNYFYLFLIGIFFIASIVYFFLIYNIKNDNLNISIKLAKHQLSKVKNHNYEVLFLGDSSLGNSIDAKAWEEITGSKTANLALQGNFSFSGAYALLKKAKKEKLKTIYIITSLSVWMRKESRSFSMINELDKYQNNIFYLANLHLNFTDFKRMINLTFFNSYQDLDGKIDDDYVSQRKKVSFNDHHFNLDYNRIVNSKINYLNKIFNFCKVNELDCIHIHGPIIKKICEHKNFPIYISRVNNLLKSHQIKHVNLPICFDNFKIGDEPDHLENKYKKEFTKEYFKLISNYLFY